MQLAGLLHGAHRCCGTWIFPSPRWWVPTRAKTRSAISSRRHGQVFVKPPFKGGVGKKGKSGLVGRARDLRGALAEKERRYFAEHRHGNVSAKANGVRSKAACPPSTRSISRSRTTPLSCADHHHHAPQRRRHRGARSLGDRHRSVQRAHRSRGLRGRQRLGDIGAPRGIVSPLVQHLPKLWELLHHYGMTTLELNPIRMRADGNGRLTPVACNL